MFGDPFAGKGTPISSEDAIAFARANLTRDHGSATLVLVTGGIENRTDGRVSPWDVMFFDASRNMVYWYVVSGEGALQGANHEYPPPEGFPLRSIEDASVDSVAATQAARAHPTFARILDEHANGTSGAFFRAQLETWRGADREGLPFWHMSAEGSAGKAEVNVDARTGKPI